MTYIKDQIPYKFNPPCNTCLGTQLDLFCSNGYCAEIDENGDVIYREYPAFNLNNTFNPKRTEDSGQGKQIGHAMPCQLEITINGVGNQSSDISPEANCSSINGTYRTVSSNESNGGGGNIFLLCDGIESNVNMYGNIYMDLEGDNDEYHIDKIGEGKYRDVSIILNIRYNNMNSSTYLCAIFKAIVGRIEYKVLGHEQGFKTRRLVIGNSNVECTKWSGLQLNYVADESSIPQDPCNSASYFNICDFSNANITITSINDKDNSLDRFKEVFLNGLNYPTIKFGRYSEYFSTDIEEGTLSNGTDVYYNYTPRSFKVELDGVDGPGLFKDNRTCYDCDNLNGSHILRYEQDAFIYTNGLQMRYIKQFRYQDDKINPETPICDKRERTIFRNDPCFPSGTSIDEIYMYINQEGDPLNPDYYVNVDVVHNPTLSFDFSHPELLVKYKKKLNVSIEGSGSSIYQEVDPCSYGHGAGGKYYGYPSFTNRAFNNSWIGAIEGGVPLHEISPLGSGICDFSNSSASISSNFDTSIKNSCFHQLECRPCNSQTMPESFLLNIGSILNKVEYSHRSIGLTETTVEPLTQIIKQSESVILSYDKDLCQYTYSDPINCDEINTQNIIRQTISNPSTTNTQTFAYGLHLSSASLMFNYFNNNQYYLSLRISYTGNAYYEINGERYDYCINSRCGALSNVEDPDSGYSGDPLGGLSFSINIPVQGSLTGFLGYGAGLNNRIHAFIDCSQIDFSRDDPIIRDYVVSYANKNTPGCSHRVWDDAIEISNIKLTAN